MSTRMSSAPSIARDRGDVRTSVSLTFGLGTGKPVTDRRVNRSKRSVERGCWRTDWFSKVLAERNFCSIGSPPIELVPLPCLMTVETLVTRRHQRISLPQGMSATWYGSGRQQVSRVKTLSTGGLFLCGSNTLRVGTDLTLVFEVPGGMVLADAVVRNVVPGEGMGVEFTKMNPQSRLLLEGLLTRLLR
jgi:PilZ domain